MLKEMYVSEIGKMDNLTVCANKLLPVEINMKENAKKDSPMEKELCFMKTEKDMKECGKTIINQVLAHIFIQIMPNLKVNG